MTCAHTSTLGVYLLGALDPEDRSTFESHLSRCDICRTELVRLAPLPGLLNQVTPADFEVTGELPVLAAAESSPVATLEAAPESPEPLVLDLPAEPEPEPVEETIRPRKRYWLIAAAAAVVIVLAVGGILGYQALRGEPAAPPVALEGVTWSASNPATGVTAKARLVQRAWGTEIWVEMDGAPPGRECKLRVEARNGFREHNQAPYREVAGWWGTDVGNDPEIPGSTSIPLENIYSLEFVDNYDTTLVEIHRPG